MDFGNIPMLKELLGKISLDFKKDDMISENAGNVYVDAYSQEYWSTSLPKLLFANGLVDKGNADNIFVLSPNLDENFSDICKAFGANVISIKNRGVLLKTLFMAVELFVFHNTESKLYEFTINGIKMGKYLADFIIRTQGEVYTINKIRSSDMKKVIAFLWAYNSIAIQFKRNKPKYFIVHETGYWYGPVIIMAEKYGAELIQCTNGNRIIEFGDKVGLGITPCELWNYELRNAMATIDHDNIDYKKWAASYYDHRLKGLTDVDAEDAYANKRVITKEEWVRESGADINKKNVVVMAHCFSDDANTTTNKSLYRDYYMWLVETLKIISKIETVNWLLKAHPGRKVYNEGDGVYDIFERYSNKKCMYILNDNVSTESLYDIADGVITVTGTCGLEFPSHGIPAVCAGFSAYGELGVCIEPKTIDEYVDVLNKMKSLEKLDEEQVDLAHKVSCAYFSLRNPGDESDSLMRKAYDYPKFSDGNDDTVSGLLKYYAENKTLKKSIFYKIGKEYKGGRKQCLTTSRFL
ncbi:MAG: hypothetical protein K6E47_08130 [Lachnospiraceae bacterium]|nr:hypothetical protein [Lachnospiraceae bacterium]